MKTLRKLLPYFMVLITCVIIAFIYLYTSHQKMNRVSYIFNRKFTDKPKAVIVEPITDFHNTTAYSNIELNNGVCYISRDTTICFGAFVKDSTRLSTSGFYPYNITQNKIDIHQCLTPFDISDPYVFQQERTLAYDGFFSESSEFVTFTFYYFSYIYVFNKRGEYVCLLKTKDNVPSPSIIRYKDSFLLERGKAYNSNFASFIFKEKIYVFSAQTMRQLGKYILDCYDLKNKKYLYSFSIDNTAKEDNNYVNHLSMRGDTICVITNKSETFFKLLIDNDI